MKSMPPKNTKVMPTPPAPPVKQASSATFEFGKVKPSTASRICLYGTGGIGKSRLWMKLPGRTAVIDADNSLPQLEAATPGITDGIAVVPFASWREVRDRLHANVWEPFTNIVIDTATELQKPLLQHVLKTRAKDGGGMATSILDYGYGKGYRYMFDEFLLLLADLDAHHRAGRNVVLVCHEHAANVPNPSGEEYKRWEPDLLKTANDSIRDKVKNWADFVLFYAYDKVVKDGKAIGSGSRTLHLDELPYFMAKSRGGHESIPVADIDFDPWPQILSV